jgi:hypothetical protein
MLPCFYGRETALSSLSMPHAMTFERSILQRLLQWPSPRSRRDLADDHFICRIMIDSEQSDSHDDQLSRSDLHNLIFQDVEIVVAVNVGKPWRDFADVVRQVHWPYAANCICEKRNE